MKEKITLGIEKSFNIKVEQLSSAHKQSSNGIYKRFEFGCIIIQLLTD